MIASAIYGYRLYKDQFFNSGGDVYDNGNYGRSQRHRTAVGPTHRIPVMAQPIDQMSRNGQENVNAPCVNVEQVT